MPKRTKRGTRKNKSRSANRSSNRSMVPAGISDVYHFHRIIQSTTISMIAGLPTLNALYFNKANLPSQTLSFLSTWDLIRIDKVKIRLVPRWNVNGTNSLTADDELPQIAWVPNYDDFANPTSFDQVLSQGNSRVRRFTNEVSFTVRPQALVAPLITSGSPSYSGLLPRDMWFNTNYFTGTNYQFPLAKIAVSAVNAIAGGGNIDVYFEVDWMLAQRLG